MSSTDELDEVDTRPGMSLADVAASVGRKWSVVAWVTATCILIGVALGLVLPDRHEATATVAVTPSTIDPGSGSQQTEINMATERVIVTSREVTEAAVEAIGDGADPVQLQDRLTVTVPTDADALAVTVAAADGDQAAREANAVADAYLEYRVAEATTLAESISSGIDAQIEVLQDEVPRGADAATVDLVANQIIELRSRRSSITGTAVNPGRVVSRAVAPEASTSPGLMVFLGAGLAGGLLLGFTFALVRDRFDPRLRNPTVIGRYVQQRVMDARGREPAAVTNRLALFLDAHRHEQFVAGTPQPAVLLCTRRMYGSSLVHQLRADELLKQQVVVAPGHGETAVARTVIDHPATGLHLVLCHPRDSAEDLTELTAGLRHWNREAALVVLSDSLPQAEPSGSPSMLGPALTSPSMAEHTG